MTAKCLIAATAALLLWACPPAVAAPQADFFKDLFVKAPGDANSDSSPTGFTSFGGKLYFAAGKDSSTGSELWVSDGTPAGTGMLKDINTRTSGTIGSDPGNFQVFDGKLYFYANNGVNGQELWVTDGTSDGTQMVEDINPGSDGSPGFTRLVPFNGKLYFGAFTQGEGSEMWFTDGTPGGTDILKNIDGANTSSLDQTEIAVLGNKLIFDARDTANGIELWSSDGTGTGTQILHNIRPNSDGSNPFAFKVFNGRLYFNASDGSNGSEPWSTDGTNAAIVRNINTLFNTGSNPLGFTELAGKLYFSAGNATRGRELWSTDGTGTPAGTDLVKDIYPSGLSSNPDGFSEVNGKLYFTAFSAIGGTPTGREPWVTDGTFDGTQLLKDIRPDSGSVGEGERSRALGGRLYFGAAATAGNNELWATDGTTAGTNLVRDINPAGASDPAQFTAFGDRLFFAAKTAAEGRELWTAREVPDPVGSGGGATGTGGGGSVFAPSTAGPLARAVVGVRLTGLRVSNKAFASKKKKGSKKKVGTEFRFTLSAAASVKLTVERKLKGYKSGRKCGATKPKKGKARRCTFYKRSRSLGAAGKQGANAVKFSGKGLARGRYRVTAIATAGGRASAPAAATFSVVKP